MDSIFDLEKVFFSYLGRFPALNDLSIRIEKGSKITVIGANGSGKSTFLQVLDGLIFPDKGRVRFCRQELTEKSFDDPKFSLDFRRRVGFVFQNPDVQLFCPTVEEDIVFGPLNLGFEKDTIKRRMERLVNIFGLGPLLGRSSSQLSIGEKRKVAIASTLIIDPEIIIMDEPVAGLDPTTSRHIIDIILEENTKGKTIITSTHDLHIVEEISDTVYVFNSQKNIAASGNPDSILKDAGLLEANNLVHIHSHRHKDKVHSHPHTHLEHHQGDHG